MPDPTPASLTAAEVREALDTGKVRIVRPVEPQPPGDYFIHANPERITRSGRGINPNTYFCDSATGESRAVIYSDGSGYVYGTMQPIVCPFGKPGDVLAVREEWKCQGVYLDNAQVHVAWKAGGRDFFHVPDWPAYVRATSDADWREADTMPAWASRLSIRLTAVTVERDDAGAWSWVAEAERV